MQTYGDIPQILAKSGYVNLKLANRWMRMIGFRNILIHEYLDVDRKIVYDVLQNRLEDLHFLKEALARFL